MIQINLFTKQKKDLPTFKANIWSLKWKGGRWIIN